MSESEKAKMSADMLEPDRASVYANGVVVDVVANDDGSVYVEFSADKRKQQAVGEDVFIDRYKYRTPHVKVRLAEVPA